MTAQTFVKWPSTAGKRQTGNEKSGTDRTRIENPKMTNANEFTPGHGMMPLVILSSLSSRCGRGPGRCSLPQRKQPKPSSGFMMVLTLEFGHLSSSSCCSSSWPLLTVYGDETAPLDVGESHLFLFLSCCFSCCLVVVNAPTTSMTRGVSNKQTNADASAQNSPGARTRQNRNGARTPGVAVSATIAVAKEKKKKTRNIKKKKL